MENLRALRGTSESSLFPVCYALAKCQGIRAPNSSRFFFSFPPFPLDHVGAEVRKDHGGTRAGDENSQLHHMLEKNVVRCHMCIQSRPFLSFSPPFLFPLFFSSFLRRDQSKEDSKQRPRPGSSVPCSRGSGTSPPFFPFFSPPLPPLFGTITLKSPMPEESRAYNLRGKDELQGANLPTKARPPFSPLFSLFPRMDELSSVHCDLIFCTHRYRRPPRCKTMTASLPFPSLPRNGWHAQKIERPGMRNRLCRQPFNALLPATSRMTRARSVPPFFFPPFSFPLR